MLGLFVCVCIALWIIVARNIAQNRRDNFLSYPPDNHHCSSYVCLTEGGTKTGDYINQGTVVVCGTCRSNCKLVSEIQRGRRGHWDSNAG